MPHALFADAEALTFDCYGTLIDWEAGLRAALRRVLGANAARVPDDALLGAFARLESEFERGHADSFVSYREVLRRVQGELAARFNARPAHPHALAESIGDWPAFADTVAALAALRSRYRLCIVSNIDDDLFAMTRPRLAGPTGDPLSEVVTAQQVRSFKPRRAHLKEAMRRLGLPPWRIVHVAQSLFHDIGPARGMGLRTVWVNRQAGRPGATPPAEARPDLEVPGMASLAALAL